MLAPFRGITRPYTAGLSATAMHDGGVNPQYLLPSGGIGNAPLDFSAAEKSAKEEAAKIAIILQNQAYHAAKDMVPLTRAGGPSYLSEDDLKMAGENVAQKTTVNIWLLLGGMALFFGWMAKK